jgi:hypothetical protein
MKTFTRMIAERLLRSHPDNHTDIYIDPSPQELIKITTAQGKGSLNYDPSLEKFGGVPFFVGAATLTKTHWYVWNRVTAAHWNVRKELEPELKDESVVIPIYYWYFFKTKILNIEVADFSTEPGQQFTPATMKPMIAAHPAMKEFSQVVVTRGKDYYVGL